MSEQRAMEAVKAIYPTAWIEGPYKGYFYIHLYRPQYPPTLPWFKTEEEAWVDAASRLAAHPEPGEIAFNLYWQHLREYHNETTVSRFDTLEQRYKDAWNAVGRLAASPEGGKG